MKKINSHLLALFFLLALAQTILSKPVTGVYVSAIGQLEDDEEAPFEIIANNKVHKCGGKPSNRFIVYSEDPIVGHRRFLLALEALRNNWVLTLDTSDCEDNALIVDAIRLTVQ